MSPKLQLAIGVAVFAAGALGIIAGQRAIAAFSYPIVWWGLLLAVDAAHALRWGSSPMRRDWGHFAAVVIPASVLFWLIYEYLNVAYPQWRYTGHLNGQFVQTTFGFVSFATVIPIMVEFYWLFAGPKPKLRRPPPSYRTAFVIAGLLSLLAPVLTNWFWINQAAWLGPALVLAPWVGVAGLRAVPAALLGGFVWELLNYWSWTKWQYTIHPDWPRLFEMPLLGYLGFVPFAFSTLAVDELLQRLGVRPVVWIVLWAAAAAAMYALTFIYATRGFWVPAD